VLGLVLVMLDLRPRFGDESPSGEEIELATRAANLLRWLLLGVDAAEVPHAG